MAAAASLLVTGLADDPLAAQSGSAPSFRFSVMLWTLTKVVPFDRAVDIVAEAGYTGVELVSEYHPWSDDDFARNITRFKSLHLVVDSIAGVKTGFANPPTTEALLSDFAGAVTAAHKLDCRQIILTSGARNPSLSPEAGHQACVENLKRLTELAEKASLEIVIEPIDLLENPRAYLTSVTEAFDIVRTINSPNIRVLYDVYHEQRQAGNLLEKFDRKTIDLIGLIHIADVPGRHQPGTGEIRYDALYRKLADLHYDRFFAMEFYPTGDPVANLRAARMEALQAGRT